MIGGQVCLDNNASELGLHIYQAFAAIYVMYIKKIQ